VGLLGTSKRWFAIAEYCALRSFECCYFVAADVLKFVAGPDSDRTATLASEGLCCAEVAFNATLKTCDVRRILHLAYLACCPAPVD